MFRKTSRCLRRRNFANRTVDFVTDHEFDGVILRLHNLNDEVWKTRQGVYCSEDEEPVRQKATANIAELLQWYVSSSKLICGHTNAVEATNSTARAFIGGAGARASGFKLETKD